MRIDNEHTVAGLIRKRREIAGQLERYHAILRQLVIDLDNVEATLRLFVPDIELDEIKPKLFPPRNQAYRGEITRIALSVLRQATEPLTFREGTKRVMARRGLDTDDEALVKVTIRRMGSCLRSQRRRGLVQSEEASDRKLVWRLVD